MRKTRNVQPDRAAAPAPYGPPSPAPYGPPSPTPYGPPSPAPYGQQPYAAPAVPPGYELKRKKPFYRRVWFWLLVIVVVIIVVVVSAASKAVNDATSKSHDVVYKVGGTGKANITWAQSDGSGKSKSESADSVPVPWTKSFTIKGDFSGFDVAATASNLNKSVTLTCEITVDGKTVSTDKASGAIAAVSCFGSGSDGK
jgi:hypothetical protein